ncbi:MAG: molybdopterin cofactor-binding domain-containing protein [Rectinemataceae bacterium]|jgi:CO/xanthine dehydrogenase Mo-binding subunit/aerobic-type carbon monoxide dehydrogenase small subunit (CoxS/CutS family)
MPSNRVDFVLNGQAAGVETDPCTPLLRVLREEFALTGTKQGCDLEGECGACTVIVDGAAIRSCLVPVGKIAGRSVTTIEGMGTREDPHPLQTAFLETGAVQCGYCTPGVLLSAKALLDRNVQPTREEIVVALDGNMCRCTGYVKIIEAVQLAATRMRGDPRVDGAHRDSFVVGGSSERHNGWERVSGAALFAEDISMPNLHYARVVRSPHFHARVMGLDISPALEIPGVLRVLTALDVPGENGLSDYSLDEHLLAPVGGTVRMLGDPVALVLGVSRDAAARGAQAVHVEYAPLPHTTEITRALEPETAPIHSRGNLLAEDSIQTGDGARAWREADVVIQTDYETGFQAHMAIEREAAVAYIDEVGRIAVICANHEPHWDRAHLAKILDLPQEQIRIITPPIGGSFGGKQDIWPLAAAALAAFHLRAPVQLAYSRHEVMNAAPKRHPYACHCVVGAKRDGRLLGMKFEARINKGAYDSAGRYLPNYAVVASVGPYRWLAVEARARAIYSNGPKAGQFRGFGTPQATFAMECALDELSERLGVDPLELRLRNALAENEITGLGYRAAETLGYPKVLEAIIPDYQAACRSVASFNAQAAPNLRRGVGIAGMWYRFGKFGRPLSQAEIELGLDGRITIYASSAEYGQGIETVFSQIAAEHLGVSRAALRLVNADTACTLDGDVTGASRSTYWVGGAVADAARRLRATILATAAELLDQSAGTLSLNDERVSSGRADVTLAQIAQKLERRGVSRHVRGQMDLQTRFPDNERVGLYLPMFVTGVHLAQVEVELETGLTRVLAVSAAHDVGHVINRRDAEGQIEGSIVMGLGSVLMEELLPGLSTGFSNYMIPTMRSTPEIRVHLVETPSRYGPLGVKGLGEAAMVATAPAMVNAISRAIGTRIRRLPATGERVLTAIRGKAAAR